MIGGVTWPGVSGRAALGFRQCRRGPAGGTGEGVMDVFDVIVVGGGRKACLARPRQEGRGPGDLARAGSTRVVTAVAAVVMRTQPMRVD